jgi:hypothetical protein
MIGRDWRGRAARAVASRAGSAHLTPGGDHKRTKYTLLKKGKLRIERMHSDLVKNTMAKLQSFLIKIGNLTTFVPNTKKFTVLFIRVRIRIEINKEISVNK